MTVLESGEGFVNCRVDVGGKLSNKKGVNTPTVRLPISALTRKVRSTGKACQTCPSIHAFGRVPP